MHLTYLKLLLIYLLLLKLCTNVHFVNRDWNWWRLSYLLKVTEEELQSVPCIQRPYQSIYWEPEGVLKSGFQKGKTKLVSIKWIDKYCTPRTQILNRLLLCIRILFTVRVITLAMLAFQCSPGRFPRKKQGRVISLPGKELDNAHLSSFHMVLVLTVWNKYVRHQALSYKKFLRTSWILFFERKLNPKIGVSLEQRYLKPLILELFGQLSPILPSDLNRQVLNWFTSSLVPVPLMVCCLDSICYW